MMQSRVTNRERLSGEALSSGVVGPGWVSLGVA